MEDYGGPKMDRKRMRMWRRKNSTALAGVGWFGLFHLDEAKEAGVGFRAEPEKVVLQKEILRGLQLKKEGKKRRRRRYENQIIK